MAGNTYEPYRSFRWLFRGSGVPAFVMKSFEQTAPDEAIISYAVSPKANSAGQIPDIDDRPISFCSAELVLLDAQGASIKEADVSWDGVEYMPVQLDSSSDSIGVRVKLKNLRISWK